MSRLQFEALSGSRGPLSLVGERTLGGNASISVPL